MSDFTTNPNKGIKIKIDFPDISHDEAEKRILKRFREVHENDDRALRNFNIVVIGFIAFASIICGSAIAITISEYWIPVRRAFLNFVFWLDDLPMVANWLILLPCLAFIIWFMIHRQAKKDLKAIKNPENYDR